MKQKTCSGFATSALILGIVSIGLCYIPVVNFAAIVLAFVGEVLGFIAIKQKQPKKRTILGLVLSLFAIFFAISVNNAFVDSVNEANKNLDKAFGNSTEEVLDKDLDVGMLPFEVTYDEYGYPETKLSVTLKNKTKERKSFSVTIEAVNANGDRISTDLAYIRNLGAGQSQTIDLFNFIPRDKIAKYENAHFRIIEATSRNN